MDKRLYQSLVGVAVVLTMFWLGWSAYDSYFHDRVPGEMSYHAANRFFEDGNYASALQEYETAFADNNELLDALRGQARTLLQLGRNEEALQKFNLVINRDPGFAASYANRGILHDRMGEYEKAIADYEAALRLDIELGEGPNWLTRFLRLQVEKPAGIADRARYLSEQLAKPESERVLRVPDLDEQQRSYKK